MRDALLWAFRQNYHLDKANACVHCSSVKFSPLTFSLYEALAEDWYEEEDITAEMAEVQFHQGTYELDQGR